MESSDTSVAPCPIDVDYFINVMLEPNEEELREKRLEIMKPRFYCKHCDSTFSKANDVKRHFDAVHKRRKNHKCRWCGKWFVEKRNLNRHVNQVHDKKRPFQCNECPYAAAENYILIKHKKQKHLFYDLDLN
jgi:hypothetical protein